MFFYNIKHNAFIFLCILLTMYGCNKKNKKIIVENKVAIKTIKNFDKLQLLIEAIREKLTSHEPISIMKAYFSIVDNIPEWNILMPHNFKKNQIRYAHGY